MNNQGKVLLVIPCFRESERVGPLLRELKSEFGGDGEVRVLLVDDGSGAGEADRLREVVEAAGFNAEVHALEMNQGKGGAVYAGWAQARDEEWLAFVDADGSCSAEEVKRLLSMRGEGAIFASRILMLGRLIQRRFLRHLLGRVFATLVGTFLEVPVYDSQCGLKLVPRAVFERVRALLTLKGFAFDVELLCALFDSGCTIREEPIDWHEVEGGKVKLWRDSWRMFRDVLRVREARKSENWRRVCGLVR
jgi:glycosyltransferase involved in cell wall biosynthesis